MKKLRFLLSLFMFCICFHLEAGDRISNEVLIDADGSATAVEQIQQVEPMDVYDLRGNKVRSKVTDLRGLAKGIYIINGKKGIHNKY